MGTVTVGPNNMATYSNTTPEYTLNEHYFDANGYVYRFVQIYASSAHAASAGRVFLQTSTPGVVTDDFSAGLVNECAGVALGTVALGSYGFLLCQGEYALVLKSQNQVVIAGTKLIISPSNGLAGAPTSQSVATTYKSFGVWTTGYSATVASGAAFINCL